MIVLGLTGSIGMGKSTTARLFAEEGIPVWDADAAVHRLYAAGGEAAPLVEAAFPGTTGAAGVDRARLSAAVVDDPEALARLEAIVHPLVRADRERFLAEARGAGAALAVVEVPLLYETGAHEAVDAVAVVSAHHEHQRARVMARPGMSHAKFEAIKARQMPDPEKRSRADFVIETGEGIEPAREQVRAVIAKLTQAV